MGSDPAGLSHLRLVWPQWQSAGAESIRSHQRDGDVEFSEPDKRTLVSE